MKFYKKYKPITTDGMTDEEGRLGYFKKYHPNETRPENIDMLGYVNYLTQLKIQPKTSHIEYKPNLVKIGDDLSDLDNYNKFDFHKSAFTNKLRKNLYSFIVQNKKSSKQNETAAAAAAEAAGTSADDNNDLDDAQIDEYHLLSRETKIKKKTSELHLFFYNIG
jgi:hypothetical protein